MGRRIGVFFSDEQSGSGARWKIGIAKGGGLWFDESVPEEKEPDSKGAERLAMGVATGWVIVSHRRYRRNLLFVVTLFTLGFVFVGAVPLGAYLMERPVWFAAYWIVAFLLAAFVLLLAIYDLIRIRSDHRRRMIELENELAEAAEEARRLAEEADWESSNG